MAKIGTEATHFHPFCDKCGKEADLSAMRCMNCSGNIRFSYDEKLPIIDRSKRGISRFWSRLPIVDVDNRVTIGEGSTPLIKADLGHKNLWIKNEMVNPTGSHKDRQLSLAISHAKYLGKSLSVLVSAGSTGLANAAYSARAGLKSIVFTGRGVRMDRVYPLRILGSEVIKVVEEIDLVIDELTRICAEFGIYNSSTARHINPYQSEGPKTIAYEIFEELKDAPDWMIVPAGGGGTYSAIGRAFVELFNAGLTTKVPKLVGAVPASYNALEHAHNAGYTTSEQVKKHHIGEGVPTILAKLAHIHPPDVEDALATAKLVQGFFMSASDEESIDGTEYLASQTGLYSEPSSGTGIAVLKKFLASNQIKSNETIVALVCGSGFRETTTVAELRPLVQKEISLGEMSAIVQSRL